jgi:hypothetical protein
MTSYTKTKYKIFKHPSGAIEAVKQGWSWPAFFFSLIWAMVKKMWALGVSVLVAFFVLGFFIGAVGGGKGTEAIINIIGIIVNVFFGMGGNSWRENNLLSRGYELKDTVTAANSESATALFLTDEGSS